MLLLMSRWQQSSVGYREFELAYFPEVKVETFKNLFKLTSSSSFDSSNLS